MDVGRACVYARFVRPTVIKLPTEDPRASDEGLVGKLMMSMYGTRDATPNWAREYSATLQKAGYKRGKANPCLFFSERDDCSVMVHGDDFVVGGEARTRRTRSRRRSRTPIKSSARYSKATPPS